ncbi:hypothetical protein [Polyangium jinanense]|uniref:Lipoprotein n=1 Tax=Polyangium jinanense TaxID=2829994 RepID=A0A9X3X603_9BACT|nr:hypothetical protein [Polyangium jinanense]MDC3961090.1 hypothetical protein [Polyangium jinanense]MDC3982833.1 hypothetical protein [Polyangium jinanense]
MKTKKGTIGFVALAFAGGALFTGWASAEDAPPAQEAPFGSVAALEDAGTEDAGGGGDAEAAPAAPPKQTLTISADKSPRPKDADWDVLGVEMSFSPGSTPNGCRLQHIREWVRVRCTGAMVHISMLGGNHEGVSIKLDPVGADEFIPFPQGGEVVFPVRTGDRRVFEWIGVEFGYKGMTSASSFLILSESWLPWDEGPTIYAR